MTTVGKILVFMNLVFSLVVGAFAVMDYTARTHWADHAKKIEAQYAVAAGTAKAYKDEADGLRRMQSELNEKLSTSGDPELKVVRGEDVPKVASKAATMLDERARTIDALKTQLAAANKTLGETKTALTRAENTSKAGVDDSGRSRDDTAKVLSQLKESREQNNTLVIERNRERDARVTAEIERNGHKARAEQLTQDVVRLEKMLASIKAAGGSGAAMLAKGTPGSPPPTNAEGLVRKADGNLVTISIGSDAGLQKNHELHVFRLGTSPKYVGKIRIVEITPNSAVGQAVGKLNGAMQVDDRVAPQILGGN